MNNIIETLQSEAQAYQRTADRLRPLLPKPGANPSNVGSYICGQNDGVAFGIQLAINLFTSNAGICCEAPNNQTFGPSEHIKSPQTVCMNCGRLK